MSNFSDPQDTAFVFDQEPKELGNVGFSMDDSSDLDSSTPVRLQEWSAADFSRIYVRFRPHLVKYAKKFLSNESIVEEVVQDAFLYLMTALPELDSEVGVLRFLKWKTRLLCIDVVRAQAGHLSFGTQGLDESIPSSDTNVSDELERADDAAIVRLALAQLSPRHRQAIVATVFEEKTSREVAIEMGLTENAFRQLLLRARRAFKTEFVGEADAANMSVSEALNLAAKRHRIKLIAGSALTAVLFAVFAFLPNTPGPLQSPGPTQIARVPIETAEVAPAKIAATDPVSTDSGESRPSSEALPLENRPKSSQEQANSLAGRISPEPQLPGMSGEESPDISLAVSAEDLFIVDSLTNSRSGDGFSAWDGEINFQPTANMRIRVTHLELEDFAIEILLAADQRDFVAAPRRLEITRQEDFSKQFAQYYLTFSDFILGDPNGSRVATEKTPLKNSIGQVRLDVVDGNVVSGDFKLLANF